MFKPFMLRMEGFGYLQNVRRKNGKVIARIHVANAEEQKVQEMHCADICVFEIHIPQKFEKLFLNLQKWISKRYTVRLWFFANYKDCFICNCCAENDPDRILHFYAALDEVECIYLNGIRRGLDDFHFQY